ncbi:MAG: glycosyltransferase, partial [Micrococcales bacterium]|nr:glycosyltransferase [Micrococcales bacterium]
MRVLLITAGSRGDVEPFVRLARRLAMEGHSPRLVIPDGSGVDVDGLEVASLGVDFRDLVSEVGV